MQAYTTMNLNGKYEFACGGYVFEKYPNHKAIYLDITDMATEENYNRCVRAGIAF